MLILFSLGEEKQKRYCLQVFAWFCWQWGESDRELAEIVERQSSSLTQGGAELLLLCLYQKWESRMLSHSESRDVVPVGGILVKVEYVITNLEIQGLEVVSEQLLK